MAHAKSMKPHLVGEGVVATHKHPVLGHLWSDLSCQCLNFGSRACHFASSGASDLGDLINLSGNGGGALYLVYPHSLYSLEVMG